MFVLIFNVKKKKSHFLRVFSFFFFSKNSYQKSKTDHSNLVTED